MLPGRVDSPGSAIPATALAFVELGPTDLNRRVHSDRV
jgi:hypothetical protein